MKGPPGTWQQKGPTRGFTRSVSKEVLTPEEINKLFLAKDKFGKTAWHITSEKGHLEILCTVWECAKEVLTPEEINCSYPKIIVQRLPGTW
jgi:hypothetical protein